MITVTKISKYFGSVEALKDISFEITKGEIVGFLGPNGAGKTTLMRILTGYLPPSKGRVSVAGFDMARNPLSAKQRIGYLPEIPPLYKDMVVRDYLKFSAKLKGVPFKQFRKKIDKALDDCHIRDVSSKTIGTLSKGYQQRVGIAQAIVHDPEVLILDEPTSGLDPLQIIQVRNLIKDLEERRTVILSTHILSEIEQIAKRVIIIHQGSIVKDDKLIHLLYTPEVGEKQSLEDTFLELTSDPRQKKAEKKAGDKEIVKF
ncbi:MAG: ABC transporter ATP-binding protein [Candidatus Omnitrophota bacterium]